MNGWRAGDPLPTKEMQDVIQGCRFRQFPACTSCNGMDCQSETRQGTNRRVHVQDCMQCVRGGGPPDR